MPWPESHPCSARQTTASVNHMDRTLTAGTKPRTSHHRLLRGVERGSARQSSLRGREGHHHSDEHWNHFKGNIGETSERHIDTIENWTELISIPSFCYSHCVCVCVCVFAFVRTCSCARTHLCIQISVIHVWTHCSLCVCVFLHTILYRNCFGRTVLYMCIENITSGLICITWALRVLSSAW